MRYIGIRYPWGGMGRSTRPTVLILCQSCLWCVGRGWRGRRREQLPGCGSISAALSLKWRGAEGVAHLFHTETLVAGVSLDPLWQGTIVPIGNPPQISPTLVS